MSNDPLMGKHKHPQVLSYNLPTVPRCRHETFPGVYTIHDLAYYILCKRKSVNIVLLVEKTKYIPYLPEKDIHTIWYQLILTNYLSCVYMYSRNCIHVIHDVTGYTYMFYKYIRPFPEDTFLNFVQLKTIKNRQPSGTSNIVQENCNNYFMMGTLAPFFLFSVILYDMYSAKDTHIRTLGSHLFYY